MQPRLDRSRRGARLWPLLLLLIVPALISLIEWDRRTAPRDPARAGAERAVTRAAPEPAEAAARTPAPQRVPTGAPPPPAPAAPTAPARLEYAGPRDCAGVSAYGSCDGDVARACVGEQLVSVDCAARDQRCVTTREGASCMARRGKELDCTAQDAPSCDGDRLRRCVDGTWQAIDCRMRLARCDPSGARAQCTQDPLAVSDFLARAASAPAPVESCDGQDNDLDSAIDEGLACDTIPLVAFVAQGARLRDFEARLQRDLAIVNRVFAPLVFAWERIVPTPHAAVQFQPEMFGKLAQRLSVDGAQPASAPWDVKTAVLGDTPAEEPLDFYLPVLFVERIATTPPKAGMSTLPNSRCGGVRLSDAPAPLEGLIVLSEVRAPETLAHEIGHYLGLCHTHEELSGAGLGAPAAACEQTGDGMCDTAYDPGPPRCAELASCEPYCQGVSATPDTSNLMSYYVSCRHGLSPEQLAEAERNLDLRRGWARCLSPDGCACTPGVPGQCPTEMSCQPNPAAVTGGQCMLDGPALPGAPCAYTGDCSLGSICLQPSQGARGARCARACTQSDERCTCTDVGLSYGACREDLD